MTVSVRIWQAREGGERGFGEPGKRQHYPDPDQKCVHFFDNLYYGILLLFVMGVSSIREFALPLMVGIYVRRIFFCMYLQEYCGM